MQPDRFDAITRTFGVDGTPAAAVLDGQGRVATHVFRGETDVRALLERIAPAVSPGGPPLGGRDPTSATGAHPGNPTLATQNIT
jgi:hypothetical protein